MSKKYKPKPTDDYLPFKDELLEIFELVREGDYENRRDIPVSDELLVMVKKQGIGQLAANFRGSDKTTNAKESVVVMMEQLVADEMRAPKDFSDDEITANFWGRLNHSTEKQRLPKDEWAALRDKRAAYREARAAEKAARAAGNGSHADAIIAKRIDAESNERGV